MTKEYPNIKVVKASSYTIFDIKTNIQKIIIYEFYMSSSSLKNIEECESNE